MTGSADLHTHTFYSDGLHSPEEIVAAAKAAGLRAVAVTDHDGLDAIPAATEAGRAAGIEVIAGVELSVEIENRDVHLLGYFIDPTDERLRNHLDRYRRSRGVRAEEIIRRLNAINIDLRWDAVLAQAGDAAVGRPHIAAALLEEGHVDTYEDAFQRYLGNDRPCYVKKVSVPPDEAIDVIHAARGLAVLAHPGLYTPGSTIDLLVHAGLDGIETVHPKHAPDQVRHYQRLVKELGLLESGGSDFHGAGRGESSVGNPSVPYRLVGEMKRRLGPRP
jgi:predicted metal-dependent phosphoesterase TrpH